MVEIDDLPALEHLDTISGDEHPRGIAHDSHVSAEVLITRDHPSRLGRTDRLALLAKCKQPEYCLGGILHGRRIGSHRGGV